MGKTKKKGNKNQEKPKNPMINIKPRLPKRGKELIGHLNGKPVYSVNGVAPVVVLDEGKRKPQLGKLGAGKISAVVSKNGSNGKVGGGTRASVWKDKNGNVNPRLK